MSSPRCSSVYLVTPRGKDAASRESPGKAQGASDEEDGAGGGGADVRRVYTLRTKPQFINCPNYFKCTNIPCDLFSTCGRQCGDILNIQVSLYTS